ncbi:MAG: NAD(P)/FAD-dependent oxidoreductase [Deltaproteobacteria bacterium]|nr:NAD(P)/FAD-dependent oxidoreductase [Deltaproteobacteria bacterium]MBW2121296.1 NAD(P)/FAD-dependent oxidoreductase [Deltaproteobacteria bacterium]HDZ91676.1 FAD/NAD(P)-binding oxidoreductase [Deltaproteobacteria bacterium]
MGNSGAKETTSGSSTPQYDVVIIGAGVVGNAIARELSRYALRIAVVEKELDVGMGTSARNSGVLHSGIHYKPGSLRAKLNVEGNSLMEGLCRELKVKIQYIGKLTVAAEDEEMPTLHALKEQGEANGVPGLEILDPEDMEKLQPGVRGLKALFSPTTGIICPYTFTIALAESALLNGVDYFLGEEVREVKRNGQKFTVRTRKGLGLVSKVLVNAAGVLSDKVCRMLGINDYTIYPCRGEYLVLDKRLGHHLSTLVYPAPHKGKAGLGIHLTKTVDGNILVGPSNEYVDGPEDWATTSYIMGKLREEGEKLLPSLTTSDIIRSFSGIRAKQAPPEEGGFRDFVIESRTDVPGFVNLVGIESPGLTSSPAIARMVRDMVSALVPLREKPEFKPELDRMTGYFHELSAEEQADLVAKDRDYGEIVCRCEQITRKEVLEAIENPLGVKSVTALKFRARVMMGRCQGGFCLPKIVRILQEDFGYRPEDFFLYREGSHLFTGRVRS